MSWGRWLFLFLLWPGILFAGRFPIQGPITLRTQHPVYLQTANLMPTRAKVLTPGILEIRTDHAYSNIFERGIAPDEDINLDMELYRLGVVAGYGVFPSFEVGLELPFLSFDSGFLDPFIQDFHRFFGLPNGGRESVPNGQFVYQVTSGDLTYGVDAQPLNVGDMTILAKHQIAEEGRLAPAVAWRFGFKFPTGDPDKGLGSGHPGFGWGVAAEKSAGRFHLLVNANLLVEGGNEALSGLLGSAYFDFTTAGEFSVSRRVGLIAQFTGGTSRLTGTQFEVWKGAPLDFIVGIAGEIPLQGRESVLVWQWGFSEDIRAVGPSVDFTLFASIGIRFPFGKTGLYKGDFLAQNIVFGR